MFRSRCPSERIIGVKINSGFPLLVVEQLESVVVDENVGTSALHLIRRNCSFDTSDGGYDDRIETFLVDGTLNCHVWKCARCHSDGQHGRVESAVFFHLMDRATSKGYRLKVSKCFSLVLLLDCQEKHVLYLHALSKAADNDLCEKLFLLSGDRLLHHHHRCHHKSAYQSKEDLPVKSAYAFNVKGRSVQLT